LRELSLVCFDLRVWSDANLDVSSHPEDMDEEMEDDDGSEPGPPPPMPDMPQRFRSGQ
jgi:hypothetical protein